MGKIDGVERDKATGIVLSRRDRHPLADLLKAIPSGAGGVEFSMPPELQHIIAIHLFDNLDCSPPREPKYSYREPTLGHSGLNTGNDPSWVPVGKASPVKVAAEPMVLPDPEGWSPEKLAAMTIGIRNEEIKRTMILSSDPVLDPDATTGENPTEAGGGSDLA